MEYLPKGYNYHVCSYTVNKKHEDHLDFEAMIRVQTKTEEEVQQWLRVLRETTNVTWRIDKSRPRKKQRVLFKADYRCHHNTKPRSSNANNKRRSKNTNCPAKLYITVVRTAISQGRQSGSTDPHVPLYPTLIRLANLHNHVVCASDAPRHRDFGEDAMRHLSQLCETGHLTSSAPDVLKYDLQIETSENCIYISSDGDICPELQYCDSQLGFSEGTKVCNSEALKTSSNLPNVSDDHSTLQFDKNEFSTIKQKFQDMCDELMAVINDSPESFAEPAQAMVTNFDRIRNDRLKVLSAMRMFGRYTSISSAARRASGNQRTAKHRGCTGAAQQAHRKNKLGSRRHRHAGSPTKFPTDHIYYLQQ
ncbi:uncharacterized protein [Lepisosteus oculatus]|nr:PREDICTED: uncharacterized protein LOC107080027 isoform X2 [Lepisosteus oculatus]